MDAEQQSSETEGESSSSVNIIEYIYDDEILPEIEIREVVSIDSFLKENPKFVSINQETLFVLIKQFFTNNAKAKAFLNLHKSVIDDKMSDVLANSYIYVDSSRRNNEDITQYFEQQERAKQAPTFELQQLELNKLAYPFTSYAELINDKQYLLIEEANVVLNQIIDDPYLPTDISKTISIDDIILPVLGAYWKLSSVYKLLYLYETNRIEPFKYVKWVEDKSRIDSVKELSFEDWLREHVQPSFKDEILKIISIESLHDYALILGNAGYDINNLSVYQDKLLRSHLQKLFDENEGNNASDIPSKALNKKAHIFPKIKDIYPQLTFLESVKKHYDRYRAYFQEDRFFRVQENLGSYIASLPNFQNEIDEYDPYILAMQIIQGTRTLDDVKNIINQLNIRANFNRANDLLKKLSESKTYISVDRATILFNKIDQSIRDDINEPFISLYNDIIDVKLGNDTSKYDGTPPILSQNVYEDTSPNIVINVNIANDTTSPEEEVYDSIPDNLNEQYSELSDVHDGIKEIMNYVLPFLIKIRDASGLQWDFNKWIKIYSTEIQRKSRSTRILEALEGDEISTFIIQRICINSLEISLEYINELNTPEIAIKLRNIYPAIYSDWKDDCKNAFFHALTYWLVNLLETSIKGMLDFSILNGMITFADIWSPYGPPLVDKNTTTNGIIYYISAISAIILPYTIESSSIEEKLLRIANDKYSDRIEYLKNEWTKIKDKETSQDKATQAKQSLIEASRKLLAKEKINYLPTYVKAYYYLPTFIPKKNMIAFKKQPIWAQGCCFSKLDNTYEADNDWKTHIKPLWSMKNKLAEDRWLKIPREELIIYKKSTDKQSKDNETNASKQFEKQLSCFISNKESVESSNIEVVFKPNDIWLQKSHYDILYREAREGSVMLINQCIKLAYQRTKADTILSVIESLIQLNNIQHILLQIIQAIYKKTQSLQKDSTEKTVLENTLFILNDMKRTINLFLDATGIEYTACIYRSRYILARALCLPGIPQNGKLVVADNVSTNFYSNILKENYNIITNWSKNNSMLSASEIQSYITKMREEQKKTTLNKLDVLSVDDMQLMKDMKRFGLMKAFEKIDNKEEKTPETTDNQNDTMNDDIGVNVQFDEDQEGESEWLQENTDQESPNENIDILD
jgi:hypothetical protein